MHQIDDSKASEYIGKTVLIGVTYLDRKDNLIEQTQWAGIITGFSGKEGIKIAVGPTKSPFTLPPDERGIRPAPPGVYRLRSTGEEIENPDYLATWICVRPDSGRNESKHPKGPTSPDV